MSESKDFYRSSFKFQNLAKTKSESKMYEVTYRRLLATDVLVRSLVDPEDGPNKKES